MEPPAGFARSVSGCESGEDRPDKRSVPSTPQTIEPVLLLVQAALPSRSESVGGSHCAILTASKRAQKTSMWAFQAITILKTMEQRLVALKDNVQKRLSPL